MKIALNKYFGLILFGFLLTIQSCSKSDPDSPGFEYMPDMYRSPAIEPYVDYGEIRNKQHKNYKTRLSAMIPPNMTVPYCMDCESDEINNNLPFLKANKSMAETHGLYGWDLNENDSIDNYEVAKDSKFANPIPYSNEVMAKGETLYASMCQHCHGEKGDGNGTMVKSGAWVSGGNLDYKDAAKMSLSDGQMFYSISYGKNNMGAHASILSKEEIWTLVHYVRSLQLGDKYTGAVKSQQDSTLVEN